MLTNNAGKDDTKASSQTSPKLVKRYGHQIRVQKRLETDSTLRQEIPSTAERREKTSPPPVQNLAVKLTQAQIRSYVTYAIKATTPPIFRPNHTPILSSVDLKNTESKSLTELGRP
ncbi:hypothetical protein EVAR_56638_1 [Eumeta japonica]|uniref:Uncharacterized protein n=1 Tax=Eumeta variegata TaxID=151549 RepID=A0A4C1XLV8_EUMVA|nr:hypothetical protein EVAR_56638_1 [Eumeta japonica]